MRLLHELRRLLLTWVRRENGVLPESRRKPDPHQPEDHQQEGQNTEENQCVGRPHYGGEYLRPCEEQRSRGNEPREAHSPKVSHKTRCARDTAAHEHAHVTRRGKQSYGSQKEIDSGGKSIFLPGGAGCRFDAISQDVSSQRRGHQQSSQVENTSAAIPASGGYPGRRYQIKREDATENIVRLGSHERQVRASRGHAQHGYEEDVP